MGILIIHTFCNIRLMDCATMRLLPLLLPLPAVALADTLQGRVVGVHDGDTLTVLAPGNVQHKVRLEGIDAPELGQPFGQASKQNLSRLAYGKDAQADCPKADRYKRKVCRVTVAGQDVGLAQLEAGLAWWFRRYAGEQTPQ